MEKEIKLMISGNGTGTNQPFSLKNALRPEEEWFLDISSSSFGIHQRAEKFLKLLYHLPGNIKILNEMLREIALNDIWFYSSCQEAERALRIVTIKREY